MPELTEQAEQSVPEAPVALGRGDFISCPVEELHASYRTLLPGAAQEGFAIEEEVLRLCRERQELINEVVGLSAEFPVLLGNLRAANATAAAMVRGGRGFPRCAPRRP